MECIDCVDAFFISSFIHIFKPLTDNRERLQVMPQSLLVTKNYTMRVH